MHQELEGILYSDARHKIEILRYIYLFVAVMGSIAEEGQ